MKVSYTYWQERDGKFLGYLNHHPDHWTQGEDLDDLKEHLQDLYGEFSLENAPEIKKVDEMEVGGNGPS